MKSSVILKPWLVRPMRNGLSAAMVNALAQPSAPCSVSRSFSFLRRSSFSFSAIAQPCSAAAAL